MNFSFKIMRNYRLNSLTSGMKTLLYGGSFMPRANRYFSDHCSEKIGAREQ
jgi:hypothetical protein